MVVTALHGGISAVVSEQESARVAVEEPGEDESAAQESARQGRIGQTRTDWCSRIRHRRIAGFSAGLCVRWSPATGARARC